MILSYNEIKKYVEITLEELQSSLINLGHEVEGVEKLHIDNIVVGEVVECIAHPESKKLKITQINIGNEIIQVVCGAPNVDVKQLVAVATNGAKVNGLEIKPTALAGVMSNGMICAIAELVDRSNCMPNEFSDLIYNFENANIGDDAMVSLGLDDYILDVSLTANRGDCLSYCGILRDLASLYPAKTLKINKIDSNVKNDFSSKIETEMCQYLSCTLVNDIQNKKTSDEDKLFLLKHNIKAQNYIVDKANIVMLKTGIPMHAYDASKINGGVCAKLVNEKTKFIGLDEVEYDLAQGTLVICDDEKIVSIASVIGSNETKVTDQTTSALIEVGVFNPTAVRESAKNISRKTDASIRGEKGIDVLSVVDARNILLETEIASTISEIGSIEYTPNIIEFNVKTVKIILGIDVDNTIEILEKFGFKCALVEGTTYNVAIPSWRKDIENDHDFVEEVIRYLSLDSIDSKENVSTLLSSEKIIDVKKIDVERKFEQTLLSYGLNQVITYSLVGIDDLNCFNQNVDEAIKLMLPMSSEHAYYRQSLLPSLIKTAKYNFDHQQKSVAIFEIGNTYTKECEEYKLSILLGGIKNHEINQKPQIYDYYDLQNFVANLLNEYGVEYEICVAKNEINEINKYVHAEIIVNNKVVGFIGQKHPEYIKKIKPDIFVCEINLSLIEDEIKFVKQYKQVSNSPVVSRDLTVIVKNDKTYQEITSIFKNIEYLTETNCISIYSPNESSTNYTFNISFSCPNKTFIAEEIDALVEQIINNIRNSGMEFNEGN